MSEPNLAKDAVFKESVQIKDAPKVQGYDFNYGVNYDELLKSFKTCGFQATNFGKAVDEINKMLASRDTALEGEQIDSYEEDEFIMRKHQCTIFLGYTSNIVSSGLRETIRFLVQHKLVDCIVTTAGN
jgi:deoxyhypusine synthase